MTPSQIQQKMFEGAQEALNELIEQKKKEDGYLIFSKDGTPIKVRARDIKKA